MNKRKQAIMDSATRLFAVKGYDATPVSEIAREANVSEGAIFRHFKSKEDLLYHLFKSIRENFFDDLERKFRFKGLASGLEMIISLLRLYCHFYETRETDFDLIHRNNPYQMPGIGEPCREEMKRIYDKMIDLVRVGIRLGVSDGSIRNISEDQGALLVIGLLTGTVRMRLFEPLHLSEIEAQLVSFCRNALQVQAEPSPSE
ncbi:MAG: TetR/AcrR family transcriptional regulator [Desulfovibrionaceae bacterium]|nr:TetR/AcrR family transcriptional regulator [Desulfovibrionaceae bacterium]